MPIENIPDVSAGDPISARVFNTLLRAVQRLSNLSVESPLEMHDVAGGLVLGLSVNVNPFLVRINSNYNGQGVYGGFIVPPPLDPDVTGTLTTNTNVILGDSDAGQYDGEAVIVWNAAELTPTGATGTNRTHVLPANTFIPGGVHIGSATISGSTNKARVILVDHSTSGASVDLKNGGTNVVTATPYLNLPTNRGTSDLFEFAASTIDGRNGGDLQLKAGGATNHVGIYWSASASKWVIDRLRYI